jgi:hypothetical protein
MIPRTLKHQPAIAWLLRALVVAFASVGVAACSTLDTPVGDAVADARVAMPHYSIVVPREHGWRVDATHAPRIAAEFEPLLLVHRDGERLYMANFVRNSVLSPAMRAAHAETVAADYSGREVGQMVLLGSASYTVRDVEHGRETIGGRTFYTTSYANADRQGRIFLRAVQALYFAQPFGNDHFIAVVFAEAVAPGADIDDVAAAQARERHRDDFRAMLASLIVQ